ncbi:hypothetical protein [Bacillus sp. FSL M8-0168]|uniref:hypothetical protein n=1 Tax=Bacillus sp. FSL M8-0168 TaxID=2921614 RepID=UPI0030FD87E6
MRLYRTGIAFVLTGMALLMLMMLSGASGALWAMACGGSILCNMTGDALLMKFVSDKRRADGEV